MSISSILSHETEPRLVDSDQGASTVSVSGHLAINMSKIDFNAFEAEVADIDVEAIAKEEFSKILSFNSLDGENKRTIQDIVRDTEFFLSQPEIIHSMKQLEALAETFRHLCGGADGHGGISINELGLNAANFYRLGTLSHSKEDGHNHEEGSVERDIEDSEEDYETVVINGKVVRRKKKGK